MTTSRLLTCVLPAALLLAAVPAARAQSATVADGLKAAVLRADELRLYATTEGNLAVLENLLTPDCLYVHSNGRTQTRKEFLAALASGELKYHSIRYQSSHVRLYGSETAVLTGQAQIEAENKSGRVQLNLLFTAIYVARDMQWKLASYQSTTAPKN